MSQLAQRLLPLFMRRTWRRSWRWLTSTHFHVVYHEGYNRAFPNLPNDPLRAERVLAFLLSEGLLLVCDVHQAMPASLKTLERVHGAEYLDQVHDLDALTSIMGVEILPAQIDRLLDLQRLMTGGTLRAARVALRKNALAVNLGGGFHHARAEHGGGFCIFNDVAVAIAEERIRGFRGRVLVVDLDLHDGDGTREIFAQDPDVFTFSIHGRHWSETEAVASFALELGTEVEDDAYLGAVEEHLPGVFEEFRPDLVFYLAGVDPAREDQMGDWRITPEGMFRRDARVVSLARGGDGKIPLVVLLAGGYSSEAWRYTARFLSDPLDHGRPIEPPSTDEMTIKRYRYISSLFESIELSGDGGNEFGITADDLMLPGWSTHRETRFLSFYTRHGIELVLERAGILDRLRDLGFSHPTLDFDLDDPAGHTMRTWADPEHSAVLMELRVRRDRRTLPGMELLSIEWLMLQNPRTEFGPGREPLPGQKHPGLGMLRDVVALMARACERLHLDGMSCVPSAYHISVQWYGYMHFLRREAQIRFAALNELFKGLPLSEATRAMAEGRVIDEASGEVFEWRPEPMIGPISERLQASFSPHEVGDEKEKYRLRLIPRARHAPAAS